MAIIFLLFQRTYLLVLLVVWERCLNFSLPTTPSVSSHPLELVFSDVWGPSPIPSIEGHCYFVLFVDDFSKYVWFFPLVRKSDVCDIFLKFQVKEERLFNTKIRNFQSDWGGEYRKLSSHFEKCGITHRIAFPHTHEQNGSAKRKIRHITKTGLTLLAHGSVPKKYWHFAFDTSVYLINRMPTSVLHDQSPFQVLFNQSPDYCFLKFLAA